MGERTWNGPSWLPDLLWIKCKCPCCNSVQFRAAEARPYDAFLSMFALHPVRYMFCWRRYDWVTFGGVPAG